MPLEFPSPRQTSSQGHQGPAVVYVINSFDRGGAEAGLVRLVEQGMFNGCRLTVVALVRGRGGLESRLIALGHRPEIISDEARMRAGQLPRIFLGLRRVLEQKKPQIVIASLPQANILARLSLLLQRNIIFVSFEHNTHLAKYIYELAFRLTSSRVDWMFADAAHTIDQAGARLYRQMPRRRTVVPLVCFQEPAQRTYRTSLDGTFRIVSAARFTPTKNQQALIVALATLIRSGLRVKLTLYGEGSERASCQQLATRLEVGSHAEFPGFVENWASLPADVFVLVSRHEGLCMAALEAMHAGIPVIAPVVGGMNDYADGTVMRCPNPVDGHGIAASIRAAMHFDKGALAAQVVRAADMIDGRFGAAVVQRTYREINKALAKEAGLVGTSNGPAGYGGAASLT